MTSSARVRRTSPLLTLVATALVIGLLYWARAVLIPVAVAVLLMFILSPCVVAFRRRGLPDLAAVILTVALAFSALGGIGVVMGVQVATLAQELPRYEGNIFAKIAELRGAGKSETLEGVQRMAEEVMGEIDGPETVRPGTGKPVPVVVNPPSVLWKLPSLLEAITSVGLVVVLLIFMLLRRQELRDRLIHAFGAGRLTMTTRALDEAGQRIGRYLVRHSLINGSFGAAFAAGLFLIGVPYAVTWGFLAAVLRFAPYVGVWLAASMPVALALAIFPGWVRSLAVLGLLVVLELVTYAFVEPRTYGRGAGVWDLALLVAVAFWTWLWGPIGLLLATPLTVCLAVAGKYLPGLGFMSLMLREQPVMPPGLGFFERLLVPDRHGATAIVQRALASEPAVRVFEGVFVPALGQLKRDRAAGLLGGAEEAMILASAREIAVELQLLGSAGDAGWGQPVVLDAPGELRVRLLGCPVQDAADELMLDLVRSLLDPRRCELEVVSSGLRASQAIALAKEIAPRAVCLLSVAPGGLATTRYLCKQMRSAFSDLPIIVARLGSRVRAGRLRDFVRAAGGDEVATGLLELHTQLMRVAQQPSIVPAARPGSRCDRTLGPLRSPSASPL